ncbi:MAG: magnesium transporter [Acidimicrobiales bacterium]|nr:magnesium transporter [Acidimicrobiales bacterium]
MRLLPISPRLPSRDRKEGSRFRVRRSARVRDLLGPDRVGIRQSLVALGFSSVTAVVAGGLLAAMTGTLERYPGLLVLVPAAIGMRGNIFGALGSRLATSIHAGTFRMSRRPETLVMQNVFACGVLSLVTAVALAVLTKILSPIFGLDSVIAFTDLLVLSAVGALLSFVVLIAVTLALAARSAERGWDLDDVNAPLVSAVGDVVTLPALLVASFLLDITVLSKILATMLLLLTAVSLWWSRRTMLVLVRQVMIESLPILLTTGILLVVAGVVIEHELSAFVANRAMLILVPACLATAGAIGGILSGRLSSKFHLGVIDPTAIPGRLARRDLIAGLAFALPVLILNGLLAQVASLVFGFESPGTVSLVWISTIGGTIATVLAGAIGYYGTALAVRAGVDPDTYGMPLVTSSVDLGGAAALVLTIGWMGLS